MLGISIRLAGRSVHLVRHIGDCDGCGNHAAHARLEAHPFLHMEIKSALQRDASAVADFRDLASTYGFLNGPHRLIDSEVLEHLSWLIETGRLIAVECRVPSQQGLVENRPAVPVVTSRPRSAPVEEPTKTWVEIELLDHAGKPVPNQSYLVIVPEGVKKSGKLDATGRAKITDIDHGMCQISFPDIDGREWK
jgi:hypothetical protein